MVRLKSLKDLIHLVTGTEKGRRDLVKGEGRRFFVSFSCGILTIRDKFPYILQPNKRTGSVL